MTTWIDTELYYNPIIMNYKKYNLYKIYYYNFIIYYYYYDISDLL